MSLKTFLINLIFPINCLSCAQEGDWLCPACFKKLKFASSPHSLSLPHVDRLHLAGDYQDELLARLIKSFKFKSWAALGEKLGRFLALSWTGSAWDLAAEEDNVCVIPIPLSKKRLRERGFNQAEVLARSFISHYPYTLCLDLKRNGHQRPQSSLSEKQRAQNIQGAFAWTGARLDGQIIILLDDVVTTGATLNEAARVLKEAGAKKIHGLALAKG